MKYLTLVGLLFVLGCKNKEATQTDGNPKPTATANPTPTNQGKSKLTLPPLIFETPVQERNPSKEDLFLDWEHAQVLEDASTFTFGALKLPLIKPSSLADVPGVHIKGKLSTERFLKFSAEDELKVTDEVAKQYFSLCKDITLGVESEDSSRSDFSFEESLVLRWRSRFSQTRLESLLPKLVAQKLRFSCVLSGKVTPQSSSLDEFSDLNFSVEFEVTLGEKNKHFGSSVTLPMPANARMFMLPFKNQGENETTKVGFAKVDLPSVVLRKVESAVPENFSLTTKSSASPCVYKVFAEKELSAGQLVVPQSAPLVLADAVSPGSFAVRAPNTSTGTGNLVCEQLKLEILNQKQVSIPLTCAVNDVLEKSSTQCSWDVEIVNGSDEEDVVVKQVSTVPAKVTVENFSDLSVSEKYLPVSAINPIKNSKISLVGFPSQAHREAVSRAFDLILAVHPQYYAQRIAPTLQKINYGGTSGDCVNRGAYAFLNSNQFWWCLSGAMYPYEVEEGAVTSQHVFRAILIGHESLHTAGLPHDKDDNSLQPCAGTAASLALAHATYTCKEDFCYGLRNQAQAFYAVELDYSLGNDARRNQGQCKTWTQAMNLN